MPGSLSRGYKTRVMTKDQWLVHPDRAVANGQPGLSDGVKPWVNVIFNN
jgi:hypothetical protein